MTFDPELVRQILIELQKMPPNRSAEELMLEARGNDTVLEHIELLDEAGLIEARLEYDTGRPRRIRAAHIARLTWQGHEFLGNARNEQVWARAQSLVESHGGSVSFGVLKQLLTAATVRHFSGCA